MRGWRSGKPLWERPERLGRRRQNCQHRDDPAGCGARVASQDSVRTHALMGAPGTLLCSVRFTLQLEQGFLDHNR